MGEDWMRAHAKAKKSELVRKLDAAFSDPSKAGDAEKLRNWLPTGMAFKPAEAERAKIAA
jgi:hypothetical protein